MSCDCEMCKWADEEERRFKLTDREGDEDEESKITPAV